MNTIKSALGLVALTTIIIYGCSTQMNDISQDKKQPVDYVNPYMGNISHLLVPTYPTVHLPNSLLRVFPQRNDFTDINLKGLPLVVTRHRSRAAFSLSPVHGEEEDLKPVFDLSYDQEKLTPYSWSLYLDEQDIGVDFGVSHQSAAYELKYEGDASPYLVLNSKKGRLQWDGAAISGYEVIRNNTRVYLYLVPEESPDQVSALSDGALVEEPTAEGSNACLVLRYPKSTKTLNVKYGISFIDTDQARKNLEREVAGKTVAELQATGRDLWNAALGKIKVSGGTADERTVFYTSLYRCLERPVRISEDGRYYSPFDGEVHNDQGRDFYTDDWMGFLPGAASPAHSYRF